jgi:ATP-binding cassette subfamily B protein
VVLQFLQTVATLTLNADLINNGLARGDVGHIVRIGGVMAVLAGRRTRPLFGRMQAGVDTVNRILAEQITGVRVIRAFVRDGYEQRRFGRANAELADVSLRAVRDTAPLFPTLNTAVNLFTVPIVWIGARLIDEIVRTEPSVAPPRLPVRPRHRRGELELVGAAFGYPGAEEPVLSGIDLVGRPGGTTAVLGPTGSGKSTLLGLIARLFDVTAGKVLVDGVEVRDLDPATLTGLVALIPQKTYLFAGTIATNLRYGRPDATDAQLWRPRIYLFDDCFSALDPVTDARLRAALAEEIGDATPSCWRATAPTPKSWLPNSSPGKPDEHVGEAR